MIMQAHVIYVCYQNDNTPPVSSPCLHKNDNTPFMASPYLHENDNTKVYHLWTHTIDGDSHSNCERIPHMTLGRS